MQEAAQKEKVSPRWHEVREPGTGWLLFRFDPERDLIEIKRRDAVTTVDLNEYRNQH